MDVLKLKHKFKLKGTGPIEFHLGCDFFCDEDGILCMAANKYIEKIAMGYEIMFGEKPLTKVHSPLEKGDHPELDTLELLNQNGVKQYQALIGSQQWAISLGWFDVATAVMALLSFSTAPWKSCGLDSMCQCQFVSQCPDGKICHRNTPPHQRRRRQPLKQPLMGQSLSLLGPVFSRSLTSTTHSNTLVYLLPCNMRNSRVKRRRIE